MEPHQHGSPVAWCRSTGYCGMARTWCVFCRRQFFVPSCSLSYSSLLAEQPNVLQRKGNSIKASHEFHFQPLQTLQWQYPPWCSILCLQNLATIIVRLFPAKFCFEVHLRRQKLEACRSCHRFFLHQANGKNYAVWPRDLHLQGLCHGSINHWLHCGLHEIRKPPECWEKRGFQTADVVVFQSTKKWWYLIHCQPKPTSTGRNSCLLRSSTESKKSAAVLPQHKMSLSVNLCFIYKYIHI